MDNKPTNIAQIKTFDKGIFEALSEAVIVANQKGKIISANSAAYNLFGFEYETLVGQEIEVLIPSKFYKVHKTYRSTYAESPHPRQMKGLELSASRHDGQVFPVEVSLNPVIIEGKPCVIAIIMDISKRKSMEEKLRTAELLQAEMAHEQKLVEVKNRLIAMFSHELRTPLSVLNTSAELLTNYFEKLDNEKRIHHLEVIKSQIDKVSGLLEDVLVISKAGTIHAKLKPTLTDINVFCRSICTQLNLSDDPRFSLVIDVQGEVKIDQTVVAHFLTNLLHNALKYTLEDGQITLEVTQTDEHLLFRISDTGIGIPNDEQARLFEPFYRANNANSIKGTGLGLTIVKTSVEQHGGTIEFSSEEGKGSTFLVQIPLT